MSLCFLQRAVPYNFFKDRPKSRLGRGSSAPRQCWDDLSHSFLRIDCSFGMVGWLHGGARRSAVKNLTASGKLSLTVRPSSELQVSH